MELLLAYKYLTKNKKEKFDETANNAKGWFTFIMLVVFTLLFGVLAFYLSWTSNKVLEYGFAVRLIFGIFAFLFGMHYCLIHLINKLDLIQRINHLTSTRSMGMMTPQQHQQQYAAAGGGFRPSSRTRA